MNATTLFLSVIFGSIGVGFFLFGKKQGRPLLLVLGLLLMGYPYFVNNTALMVAIGVVLTALPFVLPK
jgi:hypothetical protein